MIKNLDLQLSLFSAEVDPKKKEQIFLAQKLSMEDVVKKELILKKQSDSYVRGFIDTLYRMLSNNTISWKDRNGTNIALSTTGSTQSISLGSSNQAVAIDDYYVASLIASGTAAGQLIYGVTNNTQYGSSGVYTIGSSRVQLCTAPFVNMSGDNVVIEEVCLFGGQYSGNWYYFTHARDLTGTITLNDGQAIVVEYRHSVTV